MTDKPLDCSDLDQHMGKPMAPARMKEPLHNNDFRRWVQAMHYPNLLHYDHDFAKEGRYGRLKLRSSVRSGRSCCRWTDRLMTRTPARPHDDRHIPTAIVRPWR